MSDPTPMDPERLGLLRGWAQARVMIGSDYVREMLADRDHQERRAVQAEQLGGGEFDLRTLQVLGERPGGACSDSVAGIGSRIVRLEAEVARLRARVRVDADDVERAGLTRAHVEAWLRTSGWETLTHESGWLSFVSPDGPHVDVHLRDGWSSAQVVNALARLTRNPGLDILDEMAAMPPATSPPAPARES
jgi:hypothetical protein